MFLTVKGGRFFFAYRFCRTTPPPPPRPPAINNERFLIYAYLQKRCFSFKTHLLLFITKCFLSDFFDIFNITIQSTNDHKHIKIIY